MTTVNAIITTSEKNLKIPACPRCEYMYQTKNASDYGATKDGFWFAFICPVCSRGKKEVKVKYYTDGDFNLVEGK